MEMREIIEKILEMREMRENLKNAGNILEMWESPAQCGRVDSYRPFVKEDTLLDI